jgi:hypothetical protein
MRHCFALISLLAAFATRTPAPAAAATATGTDPEAARYRAWIAEMKDAERGPFSRLRWFCADGSVQPPQPYACNGHGGAGYQHGEWNDRVRTLRARGYKIANVLAGFDPVVFSGSKPDLDLLSQILLERFLMDIDYGWILRATYTYRGALQAQDEEAGALGIVREMLADPNWRRPERFALLRETVRLLPLQADEATAAAVRALALDISNEDKGFNDLRMKIHGAPDASDAGAVRHYAPRGRSALKADYERLAKLIDRLYEPRTGVEALSDAAARAGDAEVEAHLKQRSKDLGSTTSDEERFRLASYGMMGIRDQIQASDSVEDGLALLLASLALERVAYAAGNDLLTTQRSATRRQQLTWLGRGTAAAYGAGFLSRRELLAAANAIKRLHDARELTLAEYGSELRYLGRIPEWAGASLSFHFGQAMARFNTLEPLAHLYIQDRLRGSPLLVAGAVVDRLTRDANALAGIEHSLFGQRTGTGLRALNPGLARGRLYGVQGLRGMATDAEGVYLLPETVSDLPPVAAILTQGEGSSLSHVQLLARNLGIPNVVAHDAVLPQIRSRMGKRIVVAASPGGVVQLSDDGAAWDPVFGTQQTLDPDVVIRPDLEKLDLETQDFLPLTQIRARDSGRICGPKAANLGELKHHFGDAVPGGFVIPFGAFREYLEQPLGPGGPTVYAWMSRQYARIAEIKSDPALKQKTITDFLARLRKWIQTSDPGTEFRERLEAALASQAGTHRRHGVFVRSDTNVEDLPGFTGAGLNQTIPNVVGFDAILQAIKDVWSSPFTERSYGWRQAHMEKPEYVFPAVVVQHSFPSEKSGVMVTADVETGSREWLWIAVSEGVGGAVDGQAAESLRVRAGGTDHRLLAQATAPTKRVVGATGGLETVPASGAERLLTDAEIAQLVRIARAAPSKFEALRTEDGKALPADIEFAFADGELAILQLRPFVQSKRALRSEYLIGLDASFSENGSDRVKLDSLPRAP